MMNSPQRCIAGSVTALALTFFLGCLPLQPTTVAEPDRYILTSLGERGDDMANRLNGLPLSLGVGPVTIAAYLDRPGMVSRMGDNRLSVDEFEQWAEPLDENVARVVAENLSALLGTERVYRYPWEPALPVELQITLDVVRLDSGPDQRARLEARWSVLRLRDRGILAREASRISIPMEGPDAAAVATALSVALEQLSGEIAGRIQTLAPGESSNGSAKTDR